MLPKENRLTHRKDFDNTFKDGAGSFSNTLGIKFIKNNLKESRFGIVVSNKISKKAVTRNKIKRQIREIIHKNINEIKKGLDIMIICRPEIDKKDFSEIEKTLIQLFKKINLI
jgi:ribonuclease P protein component